MKRSLLACLGIALTLALVLFGANPSVGKSGEPESSVDQLAMEAPWWVRFPGDAIREAVIVYFWEVPASLEEFALEHGVKLIFAKEDIKMAVFETNPLTMIGAEISQRTLDFISEVSKDPRVEEAYRDGWRFVQTIREYSPEPEVRYPEGEVWEDPPYKVTPGFKVSVGFWRLPPSVEDFASKYGGKLIRFDEVLQSAYFEASNIAEVVEFIKKVSEDPYVRYVEPGSYWVRYMPAPEQMGISVFSNDGGVTHAKVEIAFLCLGYQVDWSSVSQDGAEFSVDAKVGRWTGTVAAIMTPPLSHDYVLGVLSPGSYKFSFRAWGNLVKAEEFTINP
jgi:serine protease